MPYPGHPQGIDALKTDTAPVSSAASPDSEHCMACGVRLTQDDIGLHKKLVNRGAETFLCKACLAAKFKMSLDDCDILIAHFREAGCSMFH